MDLPTTHIVRPQGLAMMPNTLIPSAFSTSTIWKTSTTTTTTLTRHIAARITPATTTTTVTKTIIQTATRTVTAGATIPPAVSEQLPSASQAAHYITAAVVVGSAVFIGAQMGRKRKRQPSISAPTPATTTDVPTVPNDSSPPASQPENTPMPSTRRKKQKLNPSPTKPQPPPSPWSTPKNRIEACADAYYNAVQENTPRLLAGESSSALADDTRARVAQRMKEYDAAVASNNSKKRKASSPLEEESPRDTKKTRKGIISSAFDGIKNVWRRCTGKTKQEEKKKKKTKKVRRFEPIGGPRDPKPIFVDFVPPKVSRGPKSPLPSEKLLVWEEIPRMAPTGGEFLGGDAEMRDVPLPSVEVEETRVVTGKGKGKGKEKAPAEELRRSPRLAARKK